MSETFVIIKAESATGEIVHTNWSCVCVLVIKYVTLTFDHPEPAAGAAVGPYIVVVPSFTVTDTVEPVL